jgi:hypothetical protein
MPSRASVALALGAVMAVLRPAQAAPVPEPPPPAQTLVFYNARLALRDEQPAEAVGLWLLHNAVRNRLGEPGIHDAEFRSVVWAAAGELGVCTDGFPEDTDGAGLWPVALHNWLVQAALRPTPPSPPAPHDAFAVGRQQRLVQLDDVLSAEELRTLTLFRTSCWVPRRLMQEAGLGISGDLRDRTRLARLLRELLLSSRQTLSPRRVRSLAAVDARIFDLDLYIAQAVAREAKTKAQTLARTARARGVSAAGAGKVEESTRQAGFSRDSEEAAILRRTAAWAPGDWMALLPERRLFLFVQARAVSADQHSLDGLVLALVDELAAQRDGAEVERWVGLLGGAGDPARRAAVWRGARGLALLGLDREAGFRERATIALHRGVAFLEEGDLREALRSFAHALRWAPESRDPASAALARRWLSYTAGRHETSPELLALVRGIVPSSDFNLIAEDLVWRAALRADAASFAASSRHRTGRSAFDLRVERLTPLAEGKRGVFLTQLRADLADEPNATLRFVRQLLERLEAEDGDVRAGHRATLTGLVALLAPMAARAAETRQQSRAFVDVLDRCQALLDGLARLDGPAARSLSPASDVFAGNLRLAPSDDLPWPFTEPDPTPPPLFVPLRLSPVEWTDDAGEMVFGWEIGE